jgi:hypothetical protein
MKNIYWAFRGSDVDCTKKRKMEATRHVASLFSFSAGCHWDSSHQKRGDRGGLKDYGVVIVFRADEYGTLRHLLAYRS